MLKVSASNGITIAAVAAFGAIGVMSALGPERAVPETGRVSVQDVRVENMMEDDDPTTTDDTAPSHAELADIVREEIVSRYPGALVRHLPSDGAVLAVNIAEHGYRVSIRPGPAPAVPPAPPTEEENDE